MDKKQELLIYNIYGDKKLSTDEYEYLVANRDDESTKLLRTLADRKRKEVYGNKIFIRGLIEIGNYCKNDCFYCGIRKSNKSCDRYRLNKEDILLCCKEGYGLGFRTFVLQGGEDAFWSDEFLCDLITEIKRLYPDCAVTLSLGERSSHSYKMLYDAGADRYLLRHETADSEHYRKLHPENLTLENRMKCLYDLKSIGFQVGCGFMVGSPFKTASTIAKDLKFIEEFKPDMCGIGPFIPHRDTPFKDYPSGTAEFTCYLLSIIRLIHPTVLLPATTALGTIHPNGRELGIKSGANVVMPNLSPIEVRKKYMLYNDKISTNEESAQSIDILKKKMTSIGYEIVTDRGDRKEF